MTSTINDELNRANTYLNAEADRLRKQLAAAHETVRELAAALNAAADEITEWQENALDLEGKLEAARRDRDKWSTRFHAKPTFATYTTAPFAVCRGHRYRPVPVSELQTDGDDLHVMHRDGGGNWEGEQ